MPGPMTPDGAAALRGDDRPRAASPSGGATACSRWSASAHRDLAVAVAEAAYRAGAARRSTSSTRTAASYAAKIGTRRRTRSGTRRRGGVRAMEGARRRGRRDRAGDGRVRARRARRRSRRSASRSMRGGRSAARWRGSAARGGCAGRSARGRPTSGRRRVYPGARPAEGAAEARAGHPLVLPARAEGPARPQGLDAAPRDAAPARDAADASRPARGARARPRHEPAR